MKLASTLLTALLIAPLAALHAAGPPSPQKPGRKPNIILFLVDDMGWMDSQPYGSKYYDSILSGQYAFRHCIRATVENGAASARAPPGMTHGILCLRDENGFLIRSKEIPPSNGPGSVRNFTIAKDAENTFAYRPGLIALIRLAEKARAPAELAKLDTTPLTAALTSAEATCQQPTGEKAYPAAIRTLRHAIRALAVPEAKTDILHLFDLEKW
jgi:hypothetical protein